MVLEKILEVRRVSKAVNEVYGIQISSYSDSKSAGRDERRKFTL